jgi:Zn-finger nucleic acid-binding protein
MAGDTSTDDTKRVADDPMDCPYCDERVMPTRNSVWEIPVCPCCGGVFAEVATGDKKIAVSPDDIEIERSVGTDT